MFALVGMAGAVASPIAGRVADAGHSLPATAAALALGAASFALPLLAPQAHWPALALLAQHQVGGDGGSGVGGWLYASQGWHAALLAGMALPLLGLAAWVWEYLEHSAARQAA